MQKGVTNLSRENTFSYEMIYFPNEFYSGLLGSLGITPRSCNASMAALAFAFFLLSLGTEGWYSTPLTDT